MRPELTGHVSRRTLFGVALGVVVTGPAEAEAVSFAAFRAEVLDVAKRLVPDLPLSDGRDERELRSGELVFGLDNFYRSVRDLPTDRREAEIVKWLRSFREMAREEPPGAWSAVKPLLRLKLIPADLEHVDLILHRRSSQRVLIAYGIDLGDRDSFVKPDDPAKWGLSPDAVHEAATANLEAMSTSIALEPRAPKEGSGHFVMVAQHDAYDAPRLLLPAFRQRLLAALGPTLLAGIPNRDFLVVWSKGMDVQAGFIRQIRQDAASQPHPLTDEIFVVTADGVRIAGALDLRP